MKLFVRQVTGDRRMARRFAVKVPLRYRLRRKAAEEQTSESENLSELGVLFSSDETLSIGAAIDVRMEVPANLNGMRAAEWICRGRVVRIEPNDSGSTRVGVEFDCYEILDLSRSTLPMGIVECHRIRVG